MRGLGTLINTATVLAGGGVGYFVGHRIPESIRTVVVQVIGLATLVMGVNYVLQSHNLVFRSSARSSARWRALRRGSNDSESG